MRDPRIIIVGAALLVPALGGAAPATDDAICLRGQFRGITASSAAGQIIGNPDPQDWGCVQERADAGATLSDRVAQPDSTPPPAPSGACLKPAFPNPAPGAVHLRFSLQVGAHVDLIVHGQTWRRGRRDVFPVRTLIDADLAAGPHEVVWDGNDAGGARVHPGVYRVVMMVADSEVCGDIAIR